MAILALCLPLSYILNVIKNYNMPQNDFIIIVIICTFVGFLFIGFLCWIAWRIMKKQGVEKATTISLWIFTGLVVAVSVVSLPEFNEKIEKRNRSLFMEGFREGFMEKCNTAETREQMAAAMDEKRSDSLDVKLENYCSCIAWGIESDEELVTRMMDEKVPVQDINNDPRVREIAMDCAMEYFPVE